MPKPQRTSENNIVVTAAPTTAALNWTFVAGTSQNSIVNAMNRITIGAITNTMSCLNSVCRYGLRCSDLFVVKERPISSGPQKNNIVNAMSVCRYPRPTRTRQI